MVALDLEESLEVATEMKARDDSDCPSVQAMDREGREEEERGQTTRGG